MTLLDAIDKTLNNRWIPISKAESISEIAKILRYNYCELCTVNPLKCKICLCSMKRDWGKNVERCCYEFEYWLRAYDNNDLPKALYWANQLVNKIKRLQYSELPK